MARPRVNENGSVAIYCLIDASLNERFRERVASVPGRSISGVVRHLIQQWTHHEEAAADGWPSTSEPTVC